MKLRRQTQGRSGKNSLPGPGARPAVNEETGLVTFIVLVLVVLLTVLVMANAHVLAHMKAELKQIEARHLKNSRPAAAQSVSPAGDRPLQP